ncbi:MAG TPA: PH domain-containing protein [Longimicrobiaceae bacterium]|nr:PH domain-containing protein [Longimicrobiaceae bacterium]
MSGVALPSEVRPDPTAAGPAGVDVADGTIRHPDPRAVDLDRLVGWIVAVPLAGGSLAVLALIALLANPASWLLALFFGLWTALAAGLVWLAVRWPVIDHRRTCYRVDADGIEIRRGVIWRSIIHVPRSRVQHTDVVQGPLQRRYGLGTLSIYTAGTEYSHVALGGLAHATALAIRDHLLPHTADDVV